MMGRGCLVWLQLFTFVAEGCSCEWFRDLIQRELHAVFCRAAVFTTQWANGSCQRQGK